MDISNTGSNLTANSISVRSSVLVAGKSLGYMKQQGLNAVALIKAAAPDPRNGNGRLLNRYA